MSDRKRYAIITPYYNEERRVLERCLQSVRAQTLPAEHFVIADGHPQAWIDDQPVRHIKLDRSHADYGNTPRAVGAMLAIAEGYEGVGFLDADNWLEPQHGLQCMETAWANPHCDYIVTRRNFYGTDGRRLDGPDLPVQDHVDTNCFFLLPGSFHMAPHYSLMPKELAPIGDRVFYAALRSRKLDGFILTEKTVNYATLWPNDYRRAGEVPPPEATRDIDGKAIVEWMKMRNPREMEILHRRCGTVGTVNIKF